MTEIDDFPANAAEIALAFCKECLGWENAHLFNDYGYVFVRESVPKHLATRSGPPWERSFDFLRSHADKAIKIAESWCNERGVNIDLTERAIGNPADRHLAMMVACVEASRKLHAPKI